MSDEDIVLKINSGNNDLIGELFVRYDSVITYYCNKFCPESIREDAHQETLLAFYSSLRDFDINKSSFKTFANLCIKRAVISNVRRYNKKSNVPDSVITSYDDIELTDNNSPEEILLNKESMNSLAEDIELKLSDLEFKVLSLFLSGNNHNEIAAKLNISYKSVDNSLNRIRSKLKSI